MYHPISKALWFSLQPSSLLLILLLAGAAHNLIAGCLNSLAR